MLTRAGRPKEDGAIAVVVAISSIALFGVAAIAVDLGGAFVRERDVQNQADFAALAGGAKLPGSKVATDPAVIAVADYLNKNQPQRDDSNFTCSVNLNCVTAGQLVDSVTSNGEVTFNAAGTRLTVTTPDTYVKFGFAGAVGVSGASIQRNATVELRSPGRVLPYFLPKNCINGPVELKDNTPGGQNANLTYDPPSANGNGLPVPNTATGIGTGGLVPPNVASQLTVSGNTFAGALGADFFLEASNDRVPADVTQMVSIASITIGTGNSGDSAKIDLPPGVYNRPGNWQVRLKNSSGWSSKFARFQVDTPPLGTGCGIASTGDFGMLDNPRVTAPTMTQMDRWGINTAKGLDHNLQLFTGSLPGEVKDSCNGLPANGANKIAGAILDQLPITDDPNCVLVQTGFQPNPITAGMITGSSSPSYKGLLDGPTLDGCDRNGGSATKSRLGYNTNDDVLSCFLATNGTVRVGDVYGPTVPAAAKKTISSRIFESPRFAVVPVINYSANPQNGFYPVVKYQPVFITDETANSKYHESYATSNNGIYFKSNNVAAVTVIPINPDALPDTASPPKAGTVPWIGSGTKIVQLVQ